MRKSFQQNLILMHLKEIKNMYQEMLTPLLQCPRTLQKKNTNVQHLIVLQAQNINKILLTI